VPKDLRSLNGKSSILWVTAKRSTSCVTPTRSGSTENTRGTLFSAAAGPPLPSTFREFAGAPFDLRSFFLDLNHHPEKLPEALNRDTGQIQFAEQSAIAPSIPLQREVR